MRCVERARKIDREIVEDLPDWYIVGHTKREIEIGPAITLRVCEGADHRSGDDANVSIGPFDHVIPHAVSVFDREHVSLLISEATERSALHRRLRDSRPGRSRESRRSYPTTGGKSLPAAAALARKSHRAFSGWSCSLFDSDVEVLIEDIRELSSVIAPVPAERRNAEPCDPVAVEFVDDGVDPVTLEPSFSERAIVAKRLVRAALCEPRLLAK